MNKMRERRYWFIFFAVFIITIAIISQLIGWTLKDSTQLIIMVVAGLGFAYLMTPLLMRW